MPINYLLIKAIQKYGSYYKGSLKVEYPVRSGNFITLEETAEKLTERNLSIFIHTEKGERPVHGQYNWFYQQAGNESLVQTRTVARGLFPVRLEEEGLAAAVEELTINIGKLYKIKCDFEASGTLPAIHNNVAMHLHFIAQEAIMNAAKHSGASVITVRLLKEKDCLVLTVQDDGVGFQAANLGRTGMGIGIMRYRAKVIGATLEVQTQPGRGTQITCKYRLVADDWTH